MTLPSSSELDAFAPAPESIKLSNGSYVRILDLNVRQFFAGMRIITHGAGQFLMQSNLSLDDDTEKFVGKLLGIFFVALPEAEDDVIAFANSMIEPVGIIDRPTDQMTDADRERNIELWQSVLVLMQNPKMEDLLDILEAVVQREAKDIMALGKRLQRMFKMFQASGLLNTATTDSANKSSEQSAPSTQTSESAPTPPALTSSAPSTAGTTTGSAA